MMQDDNEAVTSPLYTGFPSDQDDANGGSVADGTFAYDDDYSEITVPHTPSVMTRIRYGQDEDSAHDKISVSSSFMNYSYSNNYEDNSTIATATVAKARQNGEFVDTASSVGFNSTMADIDIGAESQGIGRPAPLNVTDIMQSGDDELEDSRRERRNCIPAWVANASNSIKFVIVLATAMFLASVALVSISVFVAGEGSDGSSNGNNSQSNSIGLESNVPTPFAVVVTTITNSPTRTMPPVSASPTVSDDFSSLLAPSDSPTVADSLSPSISASVSPTVVASFSPSITASTSPSIADSSSPSIADSPSPSMADSPSPSIADSPSPSMADSPSPSIADSPSPSITDSSSPSITGSSSPSIAASSAPSIADSPSPSIAVSLSPSLADSSSPSIADSSSPSIADSSSPSMVVSSSPSIADSSSPSAFPSMHPSVSSSEVSFFSLSDNRNTPDLKSKLRDLPKEHGQFIIHLGNWGNQSSKKCYQQAYERIADEYSNSIVPVFFVPGRKEWNNCPDFDESRSMWKNAFVNFEENWNMETRGYTVERQNDREENFAFAFKDAVYVGLNMVTGIIRDQTEWDARLDDNMRWVEENVEKNLDAKLIVMFGSAGVIDKNDRFFTSLEAKVNEWARDGRTNLHFLYVKQSSTDLAHFDNVRGMSNLSVLNIESDQWPPTKLSIDTERYKMTFDDTMWFEEGSDSS